MKPTLQEHRRMRCEVVETFFDTHNEGDVRRLMSILEMPFIISCPDGHDVICEERELYEHFNRSIPLFRQNCMEIIPNYSRMKELCDDFAIHHESTEVVRTEEGEKHIDLLSEFVFLMRYDGEQWRIYHMINCIQAPPQ